MANARALDKRRKSIRNIKKITRTMADKTENATLLVLTGNRGLCGGYNSNALRLGMKTREELQSELENLTLEVSGKRGVSGFRFRDIEPDEVFTQFNDQPLFAEVEPIANRYLQAYAAGTLDRLDVTYTKFHTVARQEIVNETLLPLGKIEGADTPVDAEVASGKSSLYEFVPSAQSILEEVVPSSFRVKLFKCFLDAAVSEQVARMIAMKGATEAANDMIRELSMTYNRARQSQITGEIMEVIGGVEALVLHSELITNKTEHCLTTK